MSTALTNSLLGSYETSKAAGANGDRLATDKDTFLKLLIAQLTHQDPLNPVEDKEFIAQLAQFTQVEELQNISSGITSLNELQTKQTVSTAASLIGMLVSAKGDNITKTGDYVSEVFVSIPESISGGKINVYATDASGKPTSLVFSDELGSVPAATYPYTWSGKDNSGNTLADGTYIITVNGTTASGNNVLCEFSSIGLVSRVETAKDGNHMLYLNDGRTVKFNDVEIISYYSDGSKSGDGKKNGDAAPADGETPPAEDEPDPVGAP